MWKSNPLKLFNLTQGDSIMNITYKLDKVKKNNWKSCFLHIRAELARLYGQYRYLLESDILCYEPDKFVS